MNNLVLQQVVADQKKMASSKKRGVRRLADLDKHFRSRQISVISGVRRSGKSTLVLQLADLYPDFHFVTFDDERLINFTVSDFNALLVELNRHSSSKVIFLDEVQNVDSWERFARRIHDDEYKVYVTGSNSKLLSSELATHLTGRYIRTELFPFSFAEFLSLRDLDFRDKTTENLGKISGAFDFYMLNGGFPEYLTTGDREFLHRVYEDIIYRDLIVRFGIKNIKGFKNLVQYLFTNFTKELNYNSLAGILGFSSTTSVRDYISFLSESYLLFELYRYDHSLKKQYQTDKKIFVIDNGLRNAVSFRTGQDKGKMLENLVFLELRRRGLECWYYRTRKNLEVDFIWFTGQAQLVQVCYDLSDPLTYRRETLALEQAMTELSVNESVIISCSERKEVKTPAGSIRIIPAQEWLLTDQEISA